MDWDAALIVIFPLTLKLLLKFNEPVNANAFIILLVLDYIIFNYLSSGRTETIHFKKI